MHELPASSAALAQKHSNKSTENPSIFATDRSLTEEIFPYESPILVSQLGETSFLNVPHSVVQFRPTSCAKVVAAKMSERARNAESMEKI